MNTVVRRRAHHPVARMVWWGVLRPTLWLIVLAVRPWGRLRFGALPSERIGHQAANTELYLRRRARERER